ncbi:DUF2589 domain-containing protein [Bacteroides neonati]|uniref:DUF2589 domain-containing protein n=1 Tax=Bacteroides neonati TaxID=1347393 RepID=UPI0004B9D560|nr:DUF2589 domain-containing protein [Bacteroides neonati]
MEEQSNLSPDQSQEEQSSKRPDNCVPDSFTGLPIDGLIGGPLRAAAEAQQELANSTKEFLGKMAAEEKKDQ